MSIIPLSKSRIGVKKTINTCLRKAEIFYGKRNCSTTDCLYDFTPIKIRAGTVDTPLDVFVFYLFQLHVFEFLQLSRSNSYNPQTPPWLRL